MSSKPPFTITPTIIRLVAEISEGIGRLAAQAENTHTLKLHRVNRIHTIQGSLAIEGNTLTEKQITAILDGKRLIAPPREVQEVRNTIAAYDHLENWQPSSEKDLLSAHSELMKGLIDDVSLYRTGGVGVMAGKKVIHMAPSASRAPKLVGDLLTWLGDTDQHALIASSVFHYEFEFIHPFTDGNGAWAAFGKQYCWVNEILYLPIFRSKVLFMSIRLSITRRLIKALN